VYGDEFGEGNEQPAKPPKASQVAAGRYQYEVTAISSRATIVDFMFCPKGQELTRTNHQGTISISLPTKAGWAKTVVKRQRDEFEKEHEADKPTTVKGKTKKALLGGAAVIGSILANLIGLALTAGVCTLAARLFGGGGSFLLMFATLAYLTGFTNFLELSIFVVPAGSVLWAALGLSLLTAILHFVALMKVFDLDFMSALLASVVARLIVFFVVAWLVIAMLGTAMMVAS
jgi:hypothetical protein